MKSLDTDEKVKPEYRKYRYNLIADGQETYGRNLEESLQFTKVLIDYYSKLAAKYEKAREEPWLPVEPDPPQPKQ
ncbi:MAG: hypothetical protein ACLQIB_28615 [Isosphaeraceae bacterium]